MKEIIPIEKCNHCNKILTAAEKALNEWLCSECQWEVNNQVRDIMRDVFPEEEYIEPIELVIAKLPRCAKEPTKE